MTAIFGIEESNARGFVEQSVVCYPCAPDGKLDLHGVVSSIKNEDIVFIKHCTSQTCLHIKAVGVVLSDYPSDSDVSTCLPVEWVWQGEKVVENFGEELPLCSNALYEEHNVVVQREILDLLPEKYKLREML